MEGKTQEGSAAAAAMSVRSARKWQHGAYPSQRRKPHTWRTRPDPFGKVFESEVVPLLAADEKRVLEARTILGELDRRHPGEFSVRHLRTLQRRLLRLDSRRPRSGRPRDRTSDRPTITCRPIRLLTYRAIQQPPMRVLSSSPLTERCWRSRRGGTATTIRQSPRCK